MSGEFLEYTVNGDVFEGYVAFDRSSKDKRPAILLAHAWDGQNEHIRAMAREYAERGYIALALDAYGKGVRGDVDGDNSHLMNPLLENRALLRDRMIGALNVLRNHKYADTERVAAIGFCFGGLCVLDLARTGTTDVNGVISIHALLGAPNLPAQPIRTKVLILHGWEDPMAPQQDVLDVSKELTEAGADWHFTAFGHAMHAFTHEGANKPEQGILYNEPAARRTKTATDLFLSEILGGVPAKPSKPKISLGLFNRGDK